MDADLMRLAEAWTTAAGPRAGWASTVFALNDWSNRVAAGEIGGDDPASYADTAADANGFMRWAAEGLGAEFADVPVVVEADDVPL